MADFINSTTSSKDVIIRRLVILSSNGVVRDITKIFQSIAIYEDIHSQGISGSINLTDGNDMIGDLELHGNELLSISFGKPGEKESDGYSKTFRIYKVGDREPEGNIQSYTVFFCSEEIIFSNQLSISRSFKDADYTTYVRNICNILKINGLKLNYGNFEKSFGSNNIVLTRYKPFEAIDYFAKYAFNDNESAFLFFENRDGFNFMSLERLFSRPTLTKLKYSTARLDMDQTSAPFSLANEIQKFKFDSSFDVLKNTQTSSYSGRLFTLDLINQQYKKRDYSYATMNPKNMMDKTIPINDAKNRNDKGLHQEFETEINFQMTNLEQKNSEYFLSKVQRPLSTNVERILMQRKMQLSMLENTTVECVVPGNTLYTVGYMVDFDMPAFTRNDASNRLIDPFHSGKYLITAVRHYIAEGGRHTTALRLAKNSSSATYTRASNSDAYKKARSI